MLYDLCGNDIRYTSNSGEFNLYGRKVLVIGASDERAEGRIRGSTLAGSLVDEATLLPQTVWQTLYNRHSIPGARIFATTNPDSPYHWFKTDVVDRRDDPDLDIMYWHFGLEDNPSLEESYKKGLRKAYTGFWHKRFVEGQWAMAQGTVFDHFDPSRHVIELAPGFACEYYIGVDYGTSNPCAFVLVGYDPTLAPNMWIEKEYYWDSKKEGRQKTNSQYVEDLIRFIGDFPIEAVYVDPSAAALKVEIRRNTALNVIDADNDVLEGVHLFSTLLEEGTLKVCQPCRNLIGEFTSYVWDETAQKRGVDKPLKQHDHCIDAARYALYTRFKYGVYPVRREASPPPKAWDPMGEFFNPQQYRRFG
jgi:PBSX family phage terminase large subunit